MPETIATPLPAACPTCSEARPRMSGTARHPTHPWICYHPYCARCGRSHPERVGATICLACGGCRTDTGHDACCECETCHHCGATCETRCDACHRCPECCICRAYQYRDRESLTFTGEPTRRFPRFVGVEVECFTARDADHTALNAACNAHNVLAGSDCSIRPDSGSCNQIEVATSPARGESLVATVRALAAGLKTAGAKVNKSCGLHVHVDARDLTPAQVLSAVRLYARVEARLYKLVARSRAEGTFSAAWGGKLTAGLVLVDGETVQARRDSLDVNTYGSVERAQYARRHKHKDSSRYHGLNLNALDLYGTLEFRLHHGTVNASKVLGWAAVCSAIVEYAATHTEAEIMALRGTPAEILEKVLPDRETVQWVRARYVYFLEQERSRVDRSRARCGLPPLAPARAPRTVRAAPQDATAGLTFDPGEHEEGEAPDARGAVGRRGHG